MRQKVRSGINKPHRVLPYYKKRTRSKYNDYRYGTLEKWFRKPYEKPITCYTLFDGHKLFVSTEDAGLSRDIAQKKIREPITTKKYLDELTTLSEKTEELTILEFGANIGYYAVLGAAEINNGRMLAVDKKGF